MFFGFGDHLFRGRISLVGVVVGLAGTVFVSLGDEENRLERNNLFQVEHLCPQWRNGIQQRNFATGAIEVVGFETGLGHDWIGCVDGERLRGDALNLPDHFREKFRRTLADVDVDVGCAAGVLRLSQFFQAGDVVGFVKFFGGRNGIVDGFSDDTEAG